MTQILIHVYPNFWIKHTKKHNRTKKLREYIGIHIKIKNLGKRNLAGFTQLLTTITQQKNIL